MDANSTRSPTAFPGSPNSHADLPNARPPSGIACVFTSWKLWTSVLALVLMAIGACFTLSYLSRSRAMNYLERNGFASYVITDESEAAARHRGDWSKGFAEVVQIEITRANDDSLRHVAALDETSVLSICEDENWPLTDVGLAQLQRLNSLEEVHFTGSGFTDDAVAAILAHQPRLHSVTLDGTSCGCETLVTIARHNGLRVFELSGTPLDDATFCNLPVITNLEVFAGTGLDACAMSWLTRSPRLKELTVERSSISDADFDRLCGAVDLDRLWLEQVAVSGDALQSLARLKHLRVLRLRNCPGLTPQDILDMPVLTEVERIELSDDLVTPDVAAFLQLMPKLTGWWSYRASSDPTQRERIKQFTRIQR